MFRVEMLPAAEGDCIWIEYGDPGALHRILVDTGTPGTYRALAKRIRQLETPLPRIDLFVVTHIDSDHIGAAPHLLRKRPWGVEFGDVWFNGYRHLLAATDRLGERQAQELSVALERQEVPWNRAFEGAPVMAPASGALPSITLAGGMTLTVLSPYREQLEELIPRWEEELRGFRERRPELLDQVAADRLGSLIRVAALAESDFDEDTLPPNGSSIALLAEYKEKRILLGADAFPSVIESSVDRLLAGTGAERLALDAFKVCHHGSAHNTSRELATKLAARNCLISTNGNRHDHPHREGIARLVHYQDRGGSPVRLLFNYRTEFNAVWDDPVLARDNHYCVEYPEAGKEGIVLELE